MIVIGIDPGLTGGIACLGHRAELLGLHDMPVIQRGGPKSYVKNQVNGSALRDMLRELTADRDLNEIRVFVETPIAFPGQHVSTTAAAFLTAGIIEGVLMARGYPHTLVAPRDWKKAHQLGPSKEQARARAIRLYPAAPLNLVKHHNRAEAILIAKYGHDMVN